VMSTSSGTGMSVVRYWYWYSVEHDMKTVPWQMFVSMFFSAIISSIIFLFAGAAN
jgi:hypothetical protein